MSLKRKTNGTRPADELLLLQNEQVVAMQGNKRMKKIMKEKNQVLPDEVLSKEFLSQFKTESDVSKFLKQLHAQVLESLLRT